MSLQHIQAKEHVHWLILQDGERTRKEVPLYLDLSYMSTTRQHNLNYAQMSCRGLITDAVNGIDQGKSILPTQSQTISDTIVYLCVQF